MTDLPISAIEVPGFVNLTPREQAFVLHPDVFRDPRKAATEVGYSSATVEKRSYSMRQRLMAYIQPVVQRQYQQLAVDARRVHEELAILGFVDITDFQERIDIEMQDGGYQSVVVWKDPMQLPPHLRRAIKFVEWGSITDENGEEVQSDRPTHVVLYSKEKALHELNAVFGEVVPTNPVDDQTKLLDHLDPAERDEVMRLYGKALKRSAAERPIIEGEHADREDTVRRIAAPSPPSNVRSERVADQGSKIPRDAGPDVEQQTPPRRVRAREQRPRDPAPAPRPVTSVRPPVTDEPENDRGYRELPA